MANFADLHDFLSNRGGTLVPFNGFFRRAYRLEPSVESSVLTGSLSKINFSFPDFFIDDSLMDSSLMKLRDWWN